MPSSSSKMCQVRIVEECHVSYQTKPNNNTTNALPLTFLDIPWLLFPPIQPLFFFQIPHKDDSESEFSSIILPRLKHSLSSALEHFFPFAAKLAASSPANQTNTDLNFVTDDNSSVRLTVAYCDADFHQLCSYQPKDAHIFHQLVPTLPPISSTPTPLFAIQVTYYETDGFSIGFAYHPFLCDQRTFCNFLHCWASLCKFGDLRDSLCTPSFDRSVILDSTGLKLKLMTQWLNSQCKTSVSPLVISMASGGFRNSNNGNTMSKPLKPACGMVRATFVMGPTDIENIKQWIQTQCKEQNISYPVLLSPYVVTCAFVWSCLLRVQHTTNAKNGDRGPVYFGFIAGGITRLPYRVPINYFGNCVGFGRAVANEKELLRGDGILAAADVIAQTIKTLDDNVLSEASKWITEWEPLIGSNQHFNVVGSPKVKLYETDFGWGRPKKIDEVSIDMTRGISLVESRETKHGIEIGLALANIQMDAFATLFTQGLRNLVV